MNVMVLGLVQYFPVELYRMCSNFGQWGGELNVHYYALDARNKMCTQFESCSLQPSPVEHKCQKLQHLRTLTRKLLPVAASEISYDL